MIGGPPWGFLVLTDAPFDDTGDLYPTASPTVGRRSVSIPVDLGNLVLAWPTPVHISLRGEAERESGDLWSGTLDLPSGTLLVSDQSMALLGRFDLPPGRYLLDVDRPTTDDGAFEVHLHAG